MRKYRHAAGISQEALANLAGIHRTYVGDVERGERNLSLLNMVRLSAALGVRLSQVILEMERKLGHKA
jgi:transcriptional regulator with XRE-family HTH domain